MGFKNTTVSGVDPSAVTTDHISPTSTKGFTPLVDAHLATVSVDSLTDMNTAGAAPSEVLAYVAASTDWQGTTLAGGTVSQGSADWRYPSIGNISVGSYTATAGQRYHLGRKTSYGIVVTELPSAGAGPLTGYGIGGGPVSSSYWPTSWKVAAGHYIMFFDFRPRLVAGYNCELQPKNYTSATYIGPRVEYDSATSANPSTMIACFSASLNDEIGVEVLSGRARVSDEAWQAYMTINMIKVA